MSHSPAQLQRYWFARPAGAPAWRGGPQPVSWHGWMLFVALVLTVIVPGQMAGNALWDRAFLAAAVWFAIAGALVFGIVRLRRRMTDPERTLEDYSKPDVIQIHTARDKTARGNRN